MSHYFSEKQEGKTKPFPIQVKVAGIEFEMFSADGLFSKSEIDAGSRVLIENCIVNEEDYVLDIGCGYGIVGISLSRLHDIKILMTDINERAIEVSKMNIRRFHLKNAEARKSNIYDNIAEEFDAILSNPPQTAGKDVCFKIIEGAFAHLKPEGSFQLVARHNKGGSTFEAKMKEVFGNVSRIGKESNFTVYMSRK